MPKFEADAVEADHICDDVTPCAKGKLWRVAFYRNLRLFAVIGLPLTKGEAEKRARKENEILADLQENYITSIARLD